MKTCKTCNLEQPTENFIGNVCKSCNNTRKKLWYEQNKDKIKNNNKQRYEENKTEILNKNKIYRETNVEKIKEIKKNYLENNKEQEYNRTKEWSLQNKEYLKDYKKQYAKDNKDTIAEKKRIYRILNKDKINARERQRKLEDPLYKLMHSIRNSINKSIKRNGYKKLSRTHLILGCDFQTFKEHLESKFESWMNWNNYGLYNGTANYGWDIDHIIPSSSGTTEEETIKLNHYTNLQPLCSYYNRDVKKDNNPTIE